MNNLIIKKIPKPASASDIASGFAVQELEYNRLECLNWPESYPYRPEVTFAAAHCSDAVLLHFKVREDAVLARCGDDRGHIWEDSCVEFFLAPDINDGLYYNFEFNCIGSLYSCVGQQRQSRDFLPDKAYKDIERCPSTGSTPFEERNDIPVWELSAIIPSSCLVRHNIAVLDGQIMHGNFYKCGDRLSKPHYLSFFPVDTPKPDFHRPEFFRKIVFE